MTGFPHQWTTVIFFDQGNQAARAFDIKYDLCRRVAREHILRKQDHLSIGVNRRPFFGNDAQAVAIAVKGKAQLGIAFPQGALHIVQIL